ncbi:uncharacterized protein LOC142542257 [Primulina tabacum]|uniref:uncharacterized protein LOC142542257 n=1 Tax=Primulina tabacum TaxID=48773 RepID=UPI003F5AAA22
MASSSGAYKEGTQQGHSSVSPYNGSPVSGEWGVPTFQHQQTISMEWTPEEQTMLEEGLAKYASESNIIRYAKIAQQLKNKTVRDVALRCRWMTKKEITKRRKDDFNVRKSKERKEKVVDSSAKPSRFAIQSGFSHASGMASDGYDDGISYNDVTGVTRRLIEQNSWAFKQISSNLASHQIDENIGLLNQARENIYKILNNLNGMGQTMKKMPPLPKVNEDLASTILPPSTFPIH